MERDSVEDSVGRDGEVEDGTGSDSKGGGREALVGIGKVAVMMGNGTVCTDVMNDPVRAV